VESPPKVISATLFARRYEIDREVGQGATAKVYLARDTIGNVPVAIKILRPELVSAVSF
jgi:serine/threonine protein kinase